MRFALCTAAAILAVTGIGCSRRPAAGADQRLEARVEKGPIEITVRASGEIRSEKSNKVMPAIKRGAEITFLEPEGASVRKDQIVARFNTEEISQKLRENQARLTEVQSKLATARSELEIQIIDNQTNLKKAQQDLDAAVKELEKFIKGDRPLDERNAELKVRTSLSDLDLKRKRCEELVSLLEDGFVTQDEVEEAKNAAAAAEIALETAKIELSLLREYTLPIKHAKLESAVAAAETELEKVRKQNESRLRDKQQAVETAESVVQQQQTQLELLNRELEACEVKAPTDGVVVHGDPDRPWSRGEIEVGATFRQGQVLMAIPDTTRLQAVVNVHEADIDKVRTNQPARISIAALGEAVITGNVVRVAQVANSGGWLPSDVKEFEVRISLDGAPDLKPGFSCSAEIVVERIESALSLPMQAVHRDGDKYVVYPAQSARCTGRKEVKIGRASVDRVEILDGIGEGERVLLVAPDHKD